MRRLKNLGFVKIKKAFMIIRIVKMSFYTSEIKLFIENFNNNKEKIPLRHFELANDKEE